MEDLKIISWLSSGSGCYGGGYGYGDGCGSGSGYGSGYGYGDGYGDGCGDGDGSGYGSGYGYGDGCGDGYGDGCGDGSGYGYGDGCGYGSGDGSGYGSKSFCGKTVFVVDGLETLVTRVKGNIAKGFILRKDLTIEPCYIAKFNGYFAHGKTAKEALLEAQKKSLEEMSEEERIEKFLENFTFGKKYLASSFFEWHGILTGSCKMGRETWMKDREISAEDMFTVQEFIKLTENSYGGQIIQKIINKK